MVKKIRPTSVIERITPSKARKWLETLNYEDNRAINKRKVATLVRQIQKNLWRLNNASIGFDVKGKIIDGQHRLSAIAQAGRAVECWVIRGLETDVFTTIDRGYRRSPAQMLGMCDVPYSGTVSTAAKLLWLYETYDKNIDVKSVEVTVDEMLLVLEVHEDLPKVASKVHLSKATKIMSPGMCVFCGHFFFQADEEKAEEFFARLGDGIVAHDKVPMYTLREKLRDAKEKRVRWKNSELFSMAVRAWNAHYRNRKLSLLRMKTKCGHGENTGSRVIEIPAIAGLSK